LLAQFPEMAGSRAELLAHHYTEAGQDEIAIGYWQRAGERALRNSSYVEASRHLSRGLELAGRQPATAGHLSQTLAMQVALATALLPTKGYGSREVAEAYEVARELCERLGDTAHLFPVLYGQWASRVHRAHHEATRELGEQTLARAREVADEGARLVGERALGQSLLFTGRLEQARGHLEAAVESYDLGAHGGLALQYGLDQRTAGLSHLVVTNWLLGHPDKAAAYSAQALAHAEAVRHENSLAHTLVHAGTFFEQFRGNAAGVRGHARRLATLAEEGGFRMFLAWCRVLEGWADFELGDQDRGLSVMREGIADAKASGSVLYQSYFLTLLAQCYDQVDEAVRAGQAIEEARQFVDGYGERWYAAEVCRVKGTLLLRAGGRGGAAEELFREALGVAQEQHARSLALRSALSLAALWRTRGRLDEARSLVTPIYDGFAEGLEAPDLSAARALIHGP
jgi:adenylate cyclase